MGWFSDLTGIKSLHGSLEFETTDGHIKMNIDSPDQTKNASMEIEAHNDRGHIHIYADDQINLQKNGALTAGVKLNESGNVRIYADGGVTLQPYNSNIQIVTAEVLTDRVWTCIDNEGNGEWKDPQGGGGGGGLQSLDVTISSAQLKDLVNTPVKLIDVPAGQFLHLHSMYSGYIFNTTEYTEDTGNNYFIQINNVYNFDIYSVAIGALPALYQTQDIYQYYFPYYLNDGIYNTMSPGTRIPNYSLYLVSNGLDLTGSAGDGTVKIHISYELFTM